MVNYSLFLIRFYLIESEKLIGTWMFIYLSERTFCIKKNWKFFWNRFFLCSLADWPRSSSLDQVGLVFKKICLPLPSCTGIRDVHHHCLASENSCKKQNKTNIQNTVKIFFSNITFLFSCVFDCTKYT